MTDICRTSLEALLDFLHGRTGLWFEDRRLQHVETGVLRAMQRRGFSRFETFQELVHLNTDVADELIDELTVGETYFFRDPAHFELIRQTILPDLLRRQGPEHRPRIWSAGCASGEEAYTLAMVLAQEDLLDQAHLLATDISRRSLSKADAGLYTPWSLRHTQGNRAIARYLQRQGKHFLLDHGLRQKVKFRCHNLALDNYPSLTSEIWAMDLILCRNVMIYFSRGTIEAVARRLYDSLSDGGWLITGPSDPMLDQMAPWQTVVTRQGVVYRRTDAAASQKTQPARVDGRPVYLPLTLETAPPAEVTTPPAALPTPRGAVTADVPASRLLTRSPMPRPLPRRPEPRLATSPERPTTDALDKARSALAVGDYALLQQLQGTLCGSAEGSALWARALANTEGSTAAEQATRQLLQQHQLSPELHLLHTVLLSDLGRDAEAEEAVRRTLYLDANLAIAHFLAGSIHQRRGNLRGAVTAYRNAHELCTSLPPESELPLADGERAGRLAEAARIQLLRLRDLSEEAA